MDRLLETNGVNFSSLKRRDGVDMCKCVKSSVLEWSFCSYVVCGHLLSQLGIRRLGEGRSCASFLS